MNQNQVYVKPVEGRIARHEQTGKAVPKRGAWWPDNVNTRRAINAGDIKLATAPQAPQPTHIPAPAATVPGIAKATAPTLAQKIEQARAEFESHGVAVTDPAVVPDPAAVADPAPTTPASKRNQRKRTH